MAKKVVSVSWADYSPNISTTFNDLLKRNELTDVTLIAENYTFDAHRLVLSALSPYFRRIFTKMPVNQQAFVFLTGVSKHSLDDLLQYIYNGQVNVNEENLDTFWKTADAFGIKGLHNDNDHFSIFANSSSSSSSTRFEFNRAPNASQYQSIGINNRTKLVTHSGHQNKDQPSTTNRNATFIEHSMNRSEYVESNDTGGSFIMPELSTDEQSLIDNPMNNPDIQLERLKVFDNQKTQLPDIKRKKHAKQNDNQSLLAVTQDDRPADHDEGNHEQPSAKRSKRTKETDFDEFNIVADIRKEPDGRENLYHQNKKFCQHDKASTKIEKRWVCTKNRSEKCRAIIKTVDIDGVTMMKIVRAEHTH